MPQALARPGRNSTPARAGSGRALPSCRRRVGSLPPVSAWLRSSPTAEAVGAFVGARYGLKVRSCVLLRSLVKEVYRISTDDRRYVLKLCRHGGWSTGEVAWEQDLVAYVIDREVACPAPVPMLDGSRCGELEARKVRGRPRCRSMWRGRNRSHRPATSSTGTSVASSGGSMRLGRASAAAIRGGPPA